MKWTKNFLRKFLYPSKWVLILVPLISFTALILIFAFQGTRSALTYLIYCMSAYSLVIWVVALPKLIKRTKAVIPDSRIARKLNSSKITGRYINDLAFRGSISIYQGMAVNIFYVLFRIAAGIRYASTWFISIALYYLVLGGLRAYMIVCYRHRRHDVNSWFADSYDFTFFRKRRKLPKNDEFYHGRICLHYCYIDCHYHAAS